MGNKNVQRITQYLDSLFEKPVCELDFANAYELVVAVILSAQCTDKRVNTVTPFLFEKYKNVFELKNANILQLEGIIRSCGFFRNKAKNLINMATAVVDNFGGEIPCDVDDLMTLAGVGRKTANVVTSVLFENNVIAVDTHVLRVSNRLGLIKTSNANKATELLENIFKTQRYKIHYQFVLFGRYYCSARSPKCENCGLKDICLHYKNNVFMQ